MALELPIWFVWYIALVAVVATVPAYRAIHVHRCHAPTVIAAVLWGAILASPCLIIGGLLLLAAAGGLGLH